MTVRVVQNQNQDHDSDVDSCRTTKLFDSQKQNKTKKQRHAGGRWDCAPHRLLASSLPHLDDAVPGRGDDEALRCLEGGDVRDDVVVTHRQRLWAAARRVVNHVALLLAVDLLLTHTHKVSACTHTHGQTRTHTVIGAMWGLAGTCTTSVPSMIFLL